MPPCRPPPAVSPLHRLKTCTGCQDLTPLVAPALAGRIDAIGGYADVSMTYLTRRD